MHAQKHIYKHMVSKMCAQSTFTQSTFTTHIYTQCMRMKKL